MAAPDARGTPSARRERAAAAVTTIALAAGFTLKADNVADDPTFETTRTRTFFTDWVDDFVNDDPGWVDIVEDFAPAP